MYSSRYISALAALLSVALADVNSVCLSYGVDFVDEGHYFINKASAEQFTCVSTFKGCNQGVADVLLVDPNGDESLCSQIPTTPEDDPKLSTCPILKNQMESGDWIILVIGNNGDGNPFAWQRDLVLDVGLQATSTVTPTVTFSVTTTPTTTQTSTTTASVILTTGPFSTVTIATATAKKASTITPKAVTTTTTKIFTRTSLKLTFALATTTKTVTATCTTPGAGKPDKPCTYSPTLIHPAALETPTGAPKYHRYVRKTDRAVDYEYARARIEAAKLKRDLKARAPAAPLAARAPDEPTLTVTALTPASTTITQTAPLFTTTEGVLVTTTSTSTLPPATVFTGIYTSTVTLPTPTKTQAIFKYTTVSSTITIGATWTRTTTVTPSASVTPCRNIGGHIGFGRL